MEQEAGECLKTHICVSRVERVKLLTLSRMHGFFRPQPTLDIVTFPILGKDWQTFFYFVAKR